MAEPSPTDRLVVRPLPSLLPPSTSADDDPPRPRPSRLRFPLHSTRHSSTLSSPTTPSPSPTTASSRRAAPSSRSPIRPTSSTTRSPPPPFIPIRASYPLLRVTAATRATLALQSTSALSSSASSTRPTTPSASTASAPRPTPRPSTRAPPHRPLEHRRARPRATSAAPSSTRAWMTTATLVHRAPTRARPPPASGTTTTRRA